MVGAENRAPDDADVLGAQTRAGCLVEAIKFPKLTLRRLRSAAPLSIEPSPQQNRFLLRKMFSVFGAVCAL
jgi:hypothetical protein